MSSVSQTLRRLNIQTASGQHLSPERRVVTLETHDNRHIDAHFLNRTNNAFCNQIASDDAAKDIDQHGLHVFIRENNFERFGDPLLGGATPDIEEIGRRTAVEFNDVHGAHCQSCAINHAANGAIEGHVVEFPLCGVGLPLVFLRGIVHCFKLRLAI